MNIKYKVVVLEWEDITGNTEPWYTIEDALELEPAHMTTIGWLIADNSDYVIVSSTLGTKKEASDINCIPRSAIKSIEEIIYNEEKDMDIPIIE